LNLVIDIGNTRAKIAAFEKGELLEEIVTSKSSLGALPAFLDKYCFEKGICSSVAGLAPRVSKLLSSLSFPMLILNGETSLPVHDVYGTPHNLGSDRLAAVFGACGQFPGKDILLVDAGTCITYEFITADGRYRGGNIAPGLSMRLKAMHAYTYLLPLVSKDGDVPLLGYDTDTAMRAGVVNGIQYEIEGYIRRFRRNYPSLLVFLTGGDEFRFDESLKSIIFADKYVVPKGLNRILEYNDTI
jgi:type III pantothenate kinase